MFIKAVIAVNRQVKEFLKNPGKTFLRKVASKMSIKGKHFPTHFLTQKITQNIPLIRSRNKM